MRILLVLILPAMAGTIAVGPSALESAEPPSKVLDESLHHLRNGQPGEWADFPAAAKSDRLVVRFAGRENPVEWAVRLRQQDVKQAWEVWLGETRLGNLHRDENDMVVYFAIPAGALVDGENELRIKQAAGPSPPDDIRVGQVQLFEQPVQEVLSAAKVELDVVDAESGLHLPARITVLDEDGALCTVGAESEDHLAVRPGTIYTASGKALFSMPTGRYTLCAGRGFEYSLDTATVEVASGEIVRRTLRIRREVPTDGYVACDTHIHTLTHSGHGDATDRERVITVAGEGIELPVFTDHNIAVDYEPIARATGLRQYFTPVIGNEVTTRVGHFNIFPVAPGARNPDASLTDWTAIFSQIYATPGVRVAILNHARDLHGGTRPFGPKLHLDVVGENVEGWQFRANGMEVINSAATQSDVLQLFHDWMGLLNRGLSVTPVGSSDSHDVARHFVGQGRTYIRCDDSDPGKIDVDEAVESFLAGKVLVSYGLLTDLQVDDEYTSGDLVSVEGDEVEVRVRVLGPSWTRAERVLVYANGSVIREFEVSDVGAAPQRAGIKWEKKWALSRPAHDVHLVAIALGPGVSESYWKTAKPYQPTSPVWRPHVVGCSGAVWLDADADGQATPAREYAKQVVAGAGHDLSHIVERLGGFDEAVAAQAAHLFRQAGGELRGPAAEAALKSATPAVQAGFGRYLRAWRASEIARLESPAP